MACYFRAYGVHFDVDAFLATSKLKWTDVRRAGEASDGRWPGAPAHNERSGIQLVVGTGINLADQVNEAFGFLASERAEISQLTNVAGVDRMVLDFGLSWDPDSAAQFAALPPELLTLAGELHCWLEVSYYLA